MTRFSSESIVVRAIQDDTDSILANFAEDNGKAYKGVQEVSPGTAFYRGSRIGRFIGLVLSARFETSAEVFAARREVEALWSEFAEWMEVHGSDPGLAGFSGDACDRAKNDLISLSYLLTDMGEAMERTEKELAAKKAAEEAAALAALHQEQMELALAGIRRYTDRAPVKSGIRNRRKPRITDYSRPWYESM